MTVSGIAAGFTIDTRLRLCYKQGQQIGDIYGFATFDAAAPVDGSFFDPAVGSGFAERRYPCGAVSLSGALFDFGEDPFEFNDVLPPWHRAVRGSLIFRRRRVQT